MLSVTLLLAEMLHVADPTTKDSGVMAMLSVHMPSVVETQTAPLRPAPALTHCYPMTRLTVRICMQPCPVFHVSVRMSVSVAVQVFPHKSFRFRTCAELGLLTTGLLIRIDMSVNVHIINELILISARVPCCLFGQAGQSCFVWYRTVGCCADGYQCGKVKSS